MRLTGSKPRQFAMLGVVAGVAIASALMSPAAQAAPSASVALGSATVGHTDTASVAAVNAAAARQAAQSRLADSLASQLGSQAAGSFVDSSGALVVNVLSSTAAAKVQAAGATARIVGHSSTQLARAQAAFDTVRAVGSTVSLDAAANQVVVSLSSAVSAADAARVRSTAARFGTAVRVERTAGSLGTLINGGRAIYTGTARCSLGFNVRNSAGTYYFITAGHCTNIGSSWYADSTHATYIGPRTGTSFPGNDYGIVRFDNANVSHPGSVYLYNGSSQDITGAGNAYVGQSACRSGSTTGVHCGSVTATNATVYYSQGTVYGLIKTNICAEPGDSGGSLYSGSTALGVTSGGSGNCSSGGTTYFQPITEPLGVYGVSVY